MSQDDRFDDHYENDDHHDESYDDHRDDSRNDHYDDNYSDHRHESSDDSYHSNDDSYHTSSNDNTSTYNSPGSLYRLSEIRDYDGNPHGDSSADDRIIGGYKYQGMLDINKDGTSELIFTNQYSGRWATAESNPVTGTINFNEYAQGGSTRVVGIYVDPLVQAGLVASGSEFDSQTRFANDLRNDNLILRGSGDYDGDGFQEVYWKTADGSAYLRALMHADGNINYANYQSEQQMNDYLTSQGYANAIGSII